MSCSLIGSAPVRSRCGSAGDAALQIFAVHIHPVGAGACAVASRAARMVGLFLLDSRTETSSPGFTMRRRNIDLAAVDLDVAVAHDLARLRAAGAEAHAVDHAVETALERGQQVLAGDAFRCGGFLEGVAELALRARRKCGGPSAFRATAGRSRRSSLCGLCHAARERSCAFRWRTSRCGSARLSEIVSCPRAGIAGKPGRCILPS